MKAAEPIEEQAREYADKEDFGGHYTREIFEMAFIAGAKSQQHLRDENAKLQKEIKILRGQRDIAIGVFAPTKSAQIIADSDAGIIQLLNELQSETKRGL